MTVTKTTATDFATDLFKVGDTRVFHCTEHGSSKFYKIKLLNIGNCYRVDYHYGKLGTSGSVDRKEFAHLGDARTHIMEKIREKLKKGYVLVSSESADVGSAKAYTPPPKLIADGEWDLF